MGVTRRDFLSATAGIFAGNACWCSAQEPKMQQRGLEKVLVIGIDGLRPDALLEATIPNIDLLWTEGAYSFRARTGEYTVTAPGWSNIFTGVWESKHGVKNNNFNGNSFEGANYQKYPTIFTRIENYQPKLETEVVASLDWLTERIITTADKRIYHPFDENGDMKVAETTVRLLQYNTIDLLFAYFEGVDVAGHNYGFDPKVQEYLSEIETIDHYVGILMEAVTRRPNYTKEDWLTILISDHGGKGKSHDSVGEEAKKVPLIMHGPRVQKGEIVPVPRQVDIAPTILTYFGIPIRPEWGLDGTVVGLK